MAFIDDERRRRMVVKLNGGEVVASAVTWQIFYWG